MKTQKSQEAAVTLTPVAVGMEASSAQQQTFPGSQPLRGALFALATHTSPSHTNILKEIPPLMYQGPRAEPNSRIATYDRTSDPDMDHA
jgi:hypothetical protein